PDVARAIALSPKNAEAYDYRSRLHGRQRHWNEALSDINRAIAINPKDPYYRADRAAIEIRIGRFNDAMADANNALEESVAAAFVVRAYVYIHQKEYDNAEKDLQSATHTYSFARASNLNSVAWIRATSPVD